MDEYPESQMFTLEARFFLMTGQERLAVARAMIKIAARLDGKSSIKKNDWDAKIKLTKQLLNLEQMLEAKRILWKMQPIRHLTEYNDMFVNDMLIFSNFFKFIF